jgi:PhnB protein
MAKAPPAGYNTVQPYLMVDGAAQLVDFLKNAFGAKERMRMEGPDGKIGHTEVEIGDSVIMLSDGGPDNTTMPAAVMVYVDDVDATYKKALAAGGTSEREPEDMFYGDRASSVRDKFGNLWFIHTHVEDVSPEEMEKRAAAAMPQG